MSAREGFGYGVEGGALVCFMVAPTGSLAALVALLVVIAGLVIAFPGWDRLCR